MSENEQAEEKPEDEGGEVPAPAEEKPAAKRKPRGRRGGRKKAAAADPGAEANAASAQSAGGEPPAAETAAEEEGAKSGRGTAALVGLLVLILVVAGAGAAGGYLLWQRLERSAAEAAAGRSALTERLEGLAGRVGDLEGRFDAVTDRADAVAERQRALEERLNGLRQRLSDGGTGWVVAEAEYLLRIANRRLQLEGDVASALEALEAADDRLAGLGEPAYLPVREAIADEITALEAVPQPDLEGLALRLSSLAERAGGLPTQRPTLTAPAPERPQTTREVSGWREFLAALWTDIKGLVTIRHERPEGLPLLPPEQHEFLRQNVRLKLETARLALLEGEPATYRSALEEAAAWVERYFDRDRSEVGRMVGALEELQGVEVAPELPDISGSLRRLKEVNQRLAEEGRSG
ncbi:MAG TPA: uroporphyrinogen-III C-methyltransferase [Gammaproteobacteria bacterium]|nr:uroporphyrinogen-III C-methyltransferase [Gammaproteobacteria bacterium]